MIWNFCIRRPILTVVIFIVIGIFGFYGYNQMAVREFPDIEFPVVNINVVLPGAEPAVIETEVLEPLEEEINTIEGIKTLSSTARPEVGTITAEFELWRDIDIAAQDVRDRVNRAQRQLPENAQAPIIQKLDPDAQAIMWLAFQGGNRWDMVELTDYLDQNLIPKLESLRGVGRIQIGGQKRFAVRIELNPDKLAAHGVTVTEVVQTIQANNVDIPSGRITGDQREFLVRTQGQFSGPEPFNDLIIAHRNGSPVRLADVGQAVPGVENERQFARFSGQPTVGLGIVKQSDANTVELADLVRQRVQELSEQLPPGISYTVATDNSTYVEENITDLQTTIIIATLLVVFVILFFLRSFWGTLISSIAIPTSLAAGMAIIYALGFSLNVLTMLALILVIGIVVDDAIVVLESCFRHLEKGADRMAGTRVGTTEIAFAAIANTLSLAAVFIPVAFTRGIIGRFFFQFGVTVAVTVFASTFTALTLTPVMCSRFLTVPDRQGWLWQSTEWFLNSIESLYKTILDWSLNHRLIVVLVAIAVFGAGILSFMGLSKEFAPQVDRGEFMVSFETPEGATLSETNQYAKKIESTLKSVPEVKHFFLAVGLSQGGGPGEVNSGVTFVHLGHRTTRERDQQEIMQAVREKLSTLVGGQAYVLEPGGPGGQGAPLQLVLQHQNLNELAEQKNDLVSWMRQQKEFVGVNSNLKISKPEISVNVDREKASSMGITVADVSNSMRFLLGEPDVSEIERGNERYEVVTELAGDDETLPSVIDTIHVRTNSGRLVSLGNLVNLEETVGPSAIHHHNRRRSITISASTSPDVVMGEALTKLRGHLAGELPPGFGWETSGQAQDMQESFYYLTISLVFAIVFVYLVLAAQFESWLHPFTIMLTLPLAAAGAYGVLYGLGMTFSVFTFIGTIMLIGLVTKNGILLVDYTNILIARGEDVMDAAREAGLVRFRPVLMTALSTILGMMPIALGYGAGGEARAPMGWSVAGGMFTATALTLIVIPVIYTLFADFIRWLRDNLSQAVRYTISLLLFGVGIWLAYVPYQVPSSALLVSLLLPVAGLFVLLSVFYLLKLEGSSLLVGVMSAGLTLIGGLLVAYPSIFAVVSDVIDTTRSGYALGLLGIIMLVAVLTNRLRSGKERLE
jgi:hydrophobe/amphiphile efflux-1 (HAE1) family protein